MSKIFKIIFYSIYFFTYSHVMANEEAKYDIVKSNDTYEIRKYSDRLNKSSKQTLYESVPTNFFLYEFLRNYH